MKLPDYPVPGEPISAGWGRQLVDFLRSLTPRPSADVAPDWTANGTTYRLARRAAPPAAPAAHPFEVRRVGDGKYRVFGGSVWTPDLGWTDFATGDFTPTLGTLDPHWVYLECKAKWPDAGWAWTEYQGSRWLGALTEPEDASREKRFVIAKVLPSGEIVQYRRDSIQWDKVPAGVVAFLAAGADIPNHWVQHPTLQNTLVMAAGGIYPDGSSGGQVPVLTDGDVASGSGATKTLVEWEDGLPPYLALRAIMAL